MKIPENNLRPYQIVNLIAFNSYGINSIAERCYFPRNLQDLTEILEETYESNPKVIGGGSNIILSTNKYKNPIILLCGFNQYLVSDANFISVGAGVKLSTLVEYTNACGLKGIQRLIGIPGSVGGAVRMNAGAYGQEIGQVVNWVDTLDIKMGKRKRWEKHELCFSYRTSSFALDNYIITDVGLKLSLDENIPLAERVELVRSESAELLAIRMQKIPYHMPNAGSVFKRTQNSMPIGLMVEQLGLKGYCINDAMISYQHAGIFVNKGFVIGKDLISLAEFVREKLASRFGVNIELEQVVI
ncbi:UDP-N-acetylmuramate dehydrogenase [Rickettsiella endosymbiont of Dermanyssus gallinae]|uniref:UDP-N-acetylmuramate dehydrogenase n=1 Tax=Rickettsiella endosymbiont of Dermanyssus gallinae TaxID=2856608 RepID=UPI001C52887D|nr:UDP-N-acetylmuramate dehydrogenase [Rickettsiella endosymbiont of Dermanyssus gallinae]